LLGVTYLDDAVLPDVVLVRFESHLVLVVVIVVVIAVRPDANGAADHTFIFAGHGEPPPGVASMGSLTLPSSNSNPTQ
jgi:hypothetical protein